LDLPTLIDTLLFFTFLSVSAVLAAGEFAFFRVRLASLERACDRRSGLLLGMLGKSQELLIKLLVGTSLCNVLAVLFVLRIAWRAFPEGAGRTAASIVSLLLAALLIAIFARLLPKIYVGHNPEAAALNLAEPVWVLLLPVYPLVKVVLFFTQGLFESRAFQVMSDDSVMVDGRARIADLNEALGTRIRKDEEYATIAGFICSLAGKVPPEGEEFESDGLRFVVRKVNRRRIERVLIVGVGIGRTAGEIEE